MSHLTSCISGCNSVSCCKDFFFFCCSIEVNTPIQFCFLLRTVLVRTYYWPDCGLNGGCNSEYVTSWTLNVDNVRKTVVPGLALLSVSSNKTSDYFSCSYLLGFIPEEYELLKVIRVREGRNRWHQGYFGFANVSMKKRWSPCCWGFWFFFKRDLSFCMGSLLYWIFILWFQWTFSMLIKSGWHKPQHCLLLEPVLSLSDCEFHFETKSLKRSP